MYELELAYMVIAHSQRDPGEYLLELQQFADRPEGPLREFAINMHLQRTLAAIKNLLAAGEAYFQQAVALAKKEVYSHMLFVHCLGNEWNALTRFDKILRSNFSG